jgi:molybdenum cofactor biosynthesis protein B
MSVKEHKKSTASIGCMILTVSDTRTKESDKSGDLMEKLLTEAGHLMVQREIVMDESETIQRIIKAASENPDIDAIITNGGTGIAGRDVTIEAVRNMLDKEIPGFGELFRMLSYQEDIGSAAMMSRAIAGVCNRTAIFSTPGSSGAVKLAMDKLILPEITHVVHEIKK